MFSFNHLSDPDMNVRMAIENEYIFGHQIILVEIVYLTHLQHKSQLKFVE